MCCMASLSRHAGWLLLAPEPREEERRYPVALFWLLVAVWVLACGMSMSAIVLDLRADGVLDRGSRSLIATNFFLGPCVVLSSSRGFLPARRRRTLLAVRAALTPAYLATAAAYVLTFSIYSDPPAPTGVVFGLAFGPGLLCVNYFVNRRRARRSRPAA